MRVLGAVSSALLLVAFNGCASGGSQHSSFVDLHEPVVVHFGETVVLGPINMEVTFSHILEDSRCPVGSQCIAAGSVTISLNVVSDRNSVNVWLTLDLDEPNEQRASAIIRGTNHVRIELQSVEPYQPEFDRIDPSKYRVTLSVSLA